MKIKLHHYFEKRFQKLPVKIQLKAKEKLLLFSKNSFDSSLNNHSLLGKYQGTRSINISGDIRAIYKIISENEVIFTDIGSHSQLYN